MIGHPLGLRINPDPARSIKDQVRQAATLGAKGVVLDAAGDLAPARLSETGRREIRHLLRSVELHPIALHLPTRRAFDTLDDLDGRLARAEAAFTLAYEIGAKLILARVGPVPPDGADDAARRSAFTLALGELGRRADHRGVRLAIETDGPTAEALATSLAALESPGLAAGLDPAALLRLGQDPAIAARMLGDLVAHSYVNDAVSTSRVAHPRGYGFPAGALDLEEYVGALEEIGYRGFLTLWPDPAQDVAAYVGAMVERFRRI